MKEAHFVAFVFLILPAIHVFLRSTIPRPQVSVSTAIMGSSSGHFTCRHADGRLHRAAIPIPKLQRRPSERSVSDLYGRIRHLWRQTSLACLYLLTDPTLCGIERQRPGSLSSTLGGQSHAPSFPALPRPSGAFFFLPFC